MPRYFIKTSYHVWTIIDRETYNPVYSIGARGIGDAEARRQARAECDRLNAAA